MSDGKSTARTGGMSTCGLLGVAFIVLRLCGVIDWSWWWVLAPFWAPLAIILALIIIVFVAILIGCGISEAAKAIKRGLR